MLEKGIFGIFCAALTVTCLSLALYIIGWGVKAISGSDMMLLLHFRGNIFVISAIITVLSAFLSNQLDKLKK